VNSLGEDVVILIDFAPVDDNTRGKHSFSVGTGLVPVRARRRTAIPPMAGSLRMKAGHWMGEEAMQKALLKAMREFE